MSGKLKQIFSLVFDWHGFSSGAQNANRTLRGVDRQLMNVAGSLGLAFGTREIFRAANDAVMLSAKMQNVKATFDGIAGSGFLKDLQSATKGAVSDFELMRRSNQALQLGLNQTDLPSYFEFARLRARQTGEEMDKMLEQLVLGLGRNSVARLDDLGLSASRIAEEMRKTGDFGKAVSNIINVEMAKAPKLMKTTADLLEENRAKYETLRIELGEKMAPAWNAVYTEANKFLETFTSILDENDSFMKMAQKGATSFFQTLFGGNGASGMVLMMQQREQLQKEGKKAAEDAKRLGASIEESAPKGKTIMSFEAMQDMIKGLNEELNKATTFSEQNRINQLIAEWTDKLEAAKRRLQPLQKTVEVTTTRTRDLSKVIKSNTGLTVENVQAIRGQVMAQSDEATAAADVFEANRKLNEQKERSTLLAQSFGVALSDAFNAALINGKGFFEIMGQYFRNLVFQIAAAVAAALLLSTILGGASAGAGFGKVLGDILGGGNAMGFLKGLGIPFLAAGGIVTRPTLAMIGEGREDEVVMPLSKLPQVAGNGIGGDVVFRIHGSELQGVLNRWDNRTKRRG